jgi:uncharacterized protein (DUF1501 family)
MSRERLAASLSRRDCLKFIGLPLAGAFGVPTARAADAGALARKRLIVITLNGGNDGLNTLVPWRDPLYRKLRPSVHVKPEGLLTVNDELALHPQLGGLMKMLQAGEVAVLQDVGYPESSLSHFESADVWASGEPRREARHEGWYGRAVMSNRAVFDAARFDACAISFDKSTGFANGRGVPVLIPGPDVFDAPREGLARAAVAADAPEITTRLAELVNEGHDVKQRVLRRLAGAARPKWPLYEEPLAVQTKLAHWFMTQGVAAPLVRIVQDGYDTHANQLPRHATLLGQLDAALVELRRRLVADGLWNDTVVMLHSEFGRRAAQNGYDGTDHGTAGPVFLVGGRLQGGVYGKRAALDRLDGVGNVGFDCDFRRVYSTLVARLWDLPANPLAAAGFAPLDLRLA